MVALRSVLLANMAQCLLKLEMYPRALDAASQSLAVNSTNAKALYRKMLAHEALKMYGEALKDLDVLATFPNHGFSLEQIAARRSAFERKAQNAVKKTSHGPCSEQRKDIIKKAFQEVCERYGLDNEETAAEMSAWLSSIADSRGEGPVVTVQDCSSRWGMDDEDARKFLAFVQPSEDQQS
eukprot:gnl/MRDRNA2_/MRDRNA2_146294_c0_seq1.p1 gnl/MRDRNA2_/MRDRNA2_146294_c0~~gnl/MRDRNA2_/MRDRNA2_146294_c0_seq1.p1  ORF type:complete len:181 (-),score=45.40 gnl/MRDRNA2_/MRDRNA2_146294_c0_seq1:36-578(-)